MAENRTGFQILSPRFVHESITATVAVIVFFALAVSCCAQTVSEQSAESSGSVQTVESESPVVPLQADPALVVETARFQALMAADRQTEALDLLIRLSRTDTSGLMPLDSSPSTEATRYVPFADSVQRQLRQLPPEMLADYRARVDGLADRWFRRALDTRDWSYLQRIVDEVSASTSGDQSLLLLGELSLRSGDSSAARAYWLQLLCNRADRAPFEPGLSLAVSATDAPQDLIVPYPDSKIDPAAVIARLVLAELLGGNRDRAQAGLAQLRAKYPDASGHFGGRAVRYVDHLSELIEQSVDWPTSGEVNQADRWQTFAGSAARNRRAVDPPGGDSLRLAWELKLADEELAAERSLAADVDGPMFPFFPVQVDNRIYLRMARQLLAVNATSGVAAFGSGDSPLVYQLPDDDWSPPVGPVGGEIARTLTVDGDRLFARLGASVPPRSAGDDEYRQAQIVCFDLRAECRLVWRFRPASGWTVEGSPVVGAAGVFVGLRRGDVLVESAVARLDRDTGRLRWLRPLASTRREDSSSGQAWQGEASSNLAALVGETVYYNTNRGVLAALRADDGQVRWLTKYRSGEEVSQSYRVPSPCIYDRGILLVAPGDSPAVLALDAATGRTSWRLADAAGVSHLLGVAGDRLIATGARVVWINTTGEKAGIVTKSWQPADTNIRATGRGQLTDTSVWFPRAGKIHVLDLQTGGESRTYDISGPLPNGGNVMLLDRHVFVTGEDRAAMFQIEPTQ